MDKITICNMALAYIGESPIESITESSEQARRCAQFYEHDRRYLLRRYSWAFAKRRAELAQIPETPPDYAYAYRYPANCVCLRKVYSISETAYDSVEYIIASDDEGRVIYCDEPRIYVEYTADIDDTNIMDEQFCEALAWKLAASMAFKLVGQPELTKLALEQCERICQEAAASAASEQNSGLGKTPGKLAICNMALSNIGEEPIEATAEISEQARRCVQFYEHDRRLLLRRYSWPFAKRRAELVRLSETPLDYAYAFRYPENCICLRKVYAVNEQGTLLDSVEYIIFADNEGKKIYCDEPRLVVEYTEDIDDASLMDEQFKEVLSWKVSASIASKLLGKPEVTKMATQEYERLCTEAVLTAANEQNSGIGKETNKLSICNRALSYIGQPPIESIADVSEQARRCVQFYEHDRRLVLRRYPWPWATRRIELSRLEESPQDYAYAYRYPSDCVCLRKLYAVCTVDGEDLLRPLPDFLQYRIASDDEGQVLYCNEPRVVAEYTADIKDNDLMDEQFCEVLSWKLASSIASKLVGDAKAMQLATAEYERLYSEAIANATNEENTEAPNLNTFIRARF